MLEHKQEAEREGRLVWVTGAGIAGSSGVGDQCQNSCFAYLTRRSLKVRTQTNKQTKTKQINKCQGIGRPLSRLAKCPWCKEKLILMNRQQQNNL